jgi:hypothetical protein
MILLHSSSMGVFLAGNNGLIVARAWKVLYERDVLSLEECGCHIQLEARAAREG